MTSYSRRSFLTAAGAATGAAAIAASPVAAAVEPGAVVTTPSGPLPPEPLIAIVRDANLGEVTVMSGTTETTYKDVGLVRRLTKASGSQRPTRSGDVA
jgi:hypothetical protein